MSFHYWQNCGQTQKKRFVNLSNSYHGETLAALAVGDVALYKKTYEPLLMDVITVASPDCYYRESGESWFDYSLRQFELMEKTLEQHHHEVCAVIIEPLIQCAGAMRMYHPVYLSKLREACDRYGVHLIADEIAVGFGRTGTLFACEQAEICPDFLCLSKGLTGGYLPLSVVLTTDTVYQAFYDNYASMKAFLHSHSFTGNPLGCRAALETLAIFREDNIIQHNQMLAQHMGRACAVLQDHPHVAEVRQHGMVLAVELIKHKVRREEFAWQERRGLRVYQQALKHGALLRPLGNVVYLMPPYVITPDEIDKLVAILIDAIEFAVKD